MNIVANIVSAWNRLKRLVYNRYEAGQRWNTSRRWIHGEVQDARFDADSATREEIVRKSRYFERNNAILNRLLDVFEQYTVGANGMPVIPSSSDEDWNRRAKKWWDGWARNCDLVSRQTFGTVQSLISRMWFRDGEIFLYKTFGESGRPRIQLLESHRVRTPSDLHGRSNIIDGIEVNAFGRPVAYYVATGLNSNEFQRVDASNILHIFEPTRPGEYRGLPFTYAVLNDLHDLDDLQLLEMQAAKANAKTNKVIKTATGQISVEDIQRTGGEIDSDTVDGKTQYYKSVFGSETQVLKVGDEYNEYAPQRPSVAVQQYWDYLASKICIGVGIPKILVFPASIQGTVARADLDVSANFFRSRSSVIQAYIREIYIWVMGWAIYYTPELSSAPADWDQVSIRPPRAVNVDIGRNSSAMLAELRSGATTYQKIYADLGEDAETELRQRGREAALIRKIAIECGVTPSEISDQFAVEIKKATEENKTNG